MIEAVSGRLEFSGDVTNRNAAKLLSMGESMLAQQGQGQHVVLDFSRVGDTDSAAVALVFALGRSAKLAQQTLALSGLPDAMLALSELYGVRSLLPVIKGA